jgi:hypothetical protein
MEIKCMDKKKARELGAAFKPGYPQTYLKSQRRPIYRRQRASQQKELDRLVACRDLTKEQAINILRNKYRKVGMRFLPKNKKNGTVEIGQLSEGMR